MRKSWFLLSVLASACLSVSAVAQEAISSGNWSDTATWAGGDLPEAGDQVTIGSGLDVVLDTNTPELGGLTINGKLRFSDAVDLELATEWIMLHGELEIGTEAKPHTRDAIITLVDNVKDEQLMGMGDRGIMLSGGTLNLHGNITNTWTKLAKTAEKGSSTIMVANADQWQVGDEIVLASTDYDPHQAETRHITAISGNTITLDAPLEYMHYGEVTFEVDQRGEVGLLTRNIKVQASEDALESYFGGHIMAMVTSQIFVECVELQRMGLHLELARYPIHWHLVGDAGQGQYIRNAAIHDTFNRCVTVHGTNSLVIENNVTYNTVGHCFFMEDGIETGNAFISNLAMQTKCHPTMDCMPTNLAAAGEYDYENRRTIREMSQTSPHTLLPSDNTVASFWITNPDNTYVGNVAAGSDANGFWMSLPEHPNGAFEGSESSLATWPRRTQFREFRGNVAHSNFDGFMFDRNINTDNTFGVTGNAHMPKEDPNDPASPGLISTFEDLTSYKNRNGGIWGRGENHIFRNVKLADNAMGYTHASGSAGRDPFTSLVVDSLFVGETDNVGNPATAEELAYGRSLPKPMIPDFPIRGYEYYDYRHDVVNTTFVNYQDNDLRETGALSYLMFTSAGVSTENAIEGATFINAKPVHFPRMVFEWGNDHLGGVAWKTAVFHDLDGSVGGIPDSYILIHDGENDSIATDAEACQVQPTWNAAVCVGDVGRLNIGGVGGGPGLGGGANAEPVTLSRNGRDYPLTRNQSNVRSRTEITVTTARPELSLSLREMDQGSWVVFELPGFASAAAGTQQDSLAALRSARDTSWFQEGDTLWVKLVSDGVGAEGPRGEDSRGETSIQVGR